MSNDQAKIYGGVVVRLADRMLLCKVAAVPTQGFTIPGTAWAELVDRCAAPFFRTSAFLNVTADDNPAHEIKLSYHVMTDDALGFALVGMQGISRRQGHAAVDEMAALFHKMFVENPAKLTPQLVDVFAKPCRDLLIRLSDDDAVSGAGNAASAPGRSSGPTDANDKVRKVRAAVDEVKNLALDNVDRVIQRGQRIDDIVQATDDLQFQAQGFQRSSRELRNQIWWNSMKGKIIIGGVASLFILLVLFTFFGGNNSNKTPKKPTNLTTFA